MLTEKEKELYFQARDRALERHVEGVEFHREMIDGFATGLEATDPKNPANSDPKYGLDLTAIIGKIKSETNFGFAFMMGVLCRLEAAKGKQYSASWQKQGEESAFYNLSRKYDRLEALHSSKAEGGDNHADTLADMAVYAAKWNILRCEIDPAEFEKWILYVRGL